MWGTPRFELHAELPSTNDRLRELAAVGAPTFTAVAARAQTRGRGRSGKSWHSAADCGLWISVLLEAAARDRPGVLTLAVGIATARAIETATGLSMALKWPNDVLFRGRKVAGVLCETAGDPGGRVIAGIGIDLRRPADFPADLQDTAGFLEELAGRPVAESEMARLLLEELRRWAAPAPATLAPPLRAEWEPRDYLSGKQIALDDGVEGVARGVEDDGALRLEGGDGEVGRVRSGGVRRVLADPPEG